MNSMPFNERELVKQGEYFKIPGPGALPKYSFPITPRENYLAAVRDKAPLWIPDYYDQVTLCPACYPDSIARGFVMGPESANYTEDSKKGGKDSFGIDWVYIPAAGGSMVKPGNPLLTDINEWQEKAHMPEVESWDWAGSKAKFKEYLKTEDAVKIMWIFTGLFERLISLMDFENASIALIDEDQEDALCDFLGACCDAYERIIKHYKDDFGCDVIYFHDDWGSQRAPLFSANACMSHIVPHLKRLVDYTHSLGMLFEMHSCGMNDMLTSCYLEAGVDLWAPQEQNDHEKILELVKGRIVIGLWDNAPSDVSEEEKYKIGRAFAKKYAPNYSQRPVYTCNLWNVEEKFKEGVYVESRKIFYKASAFGRLTNKEART
jgi:hypothetical protein